MLTRLCRYSACTLVVLFAFAFFGVVSRSSSRLSLRLPSVSSDAKSVSIAHTLPSGSSKLDIVIDHIGFDVFTYKPRSYNGGPMLIVFHGMLRDADEYRDHAIELAERHGLLIVAPQFDDDRFPSKLYQQGGLYDKNGNLMPKEQWTWSFVPEIIERMRKHEERPELPYYMIGHSAGGQFLVRYSGFMKTDAKRIVAANPGTELFPEVAQKYPYGFGRLPESLANDDAIRNYLAQPLTIYLGTEDNDSDLLDQSDEARVQGETRYERGKKAFDLAQEISQKNGWECNWRLIEANGVSHDGRAMLNHPAIEQALFDNPDMLQ